MALNITLPLRCSLTGTRWSSISPWHYIVVVYDLSIPVYQPVPRIPTPCVPGMRPLVGSKWCGRQ